MSLAEEAPPTPWGNDDTAPLDIQADRPADSGTLADRVRQQHREIKKTKPLDLRVPGPAGIVIRYLPVGAKRIEKLGQRKPDPEYGKSLTLSLDLLLAACQGVFIYAPSEPGADSEGLVPFGKVFGLGDQPVKLSTPELAEALGEQASTAREIVLAVFPTEESIVNAAQRVDIWSSDVTAQVSEDISGE